MKCLDCSTELVMKNIERYQYLESGLNHIYLTGIKGFECSMCGTTSPEIPNVRNLHLAIALGIIENPKPLLGSEIRFLRKTLGMKAKDLARKLGYEPGVLSRFENDKDNIGEQGDRLLRALFWGQKQSEIGFYKSLLEVMASYEEMNSDPGTVWCKQRDPVEIDPNHLPVPTLQHHELHGVQ